MTTAHKKYDVIIVGAGFAGLYMLYRLRSQGLSARVLEAGSGVGGTWFWNRYPGARCDVDSMEYSYQFSDELQQEWTWSERFAPQAEILEYLNHVADRFELRDDIELNCRVLSAHFDADRVSWDIESENGAFSAKYCVMATGCLSSANLPDIKGRDAFEGRSYHTGHWPHEGVDFSGQAVGIIGTGSSAVQSIPLIAEQARSLTVFQRTATYSIPARNRPLTDNEIGELKARYPEFRAQNWKEPFGVDFKTGETAALDNDEQTRLKEYEKRWENGGLRFLAAFNDTLLDEKSNETAAEFVRNKIRSIVKDPATAKALLPRQLIGCKRLCLDTNYYETFNRANVHLVDLQQQPITEIYGRGVKTTAADYELDVLVFATGFDAMTGALDKIDIRGRDGLRLKEKWRAGPLTYLGLGMAGFPNLFTVSGPGSPSVLSNMVPTIEQHVEWIADCIKYVNDNGYSSIEAREEDEQAWIKHVNDVANTTLYPGCSSWYLGANVPGKPRVFMPYVGVPPYVEKCRQVVADGYAGFTLS
ncbi:MAG: flavin-containing monooxygenase [Gammaproteobacteria bacterium]